MHCSPKSLPSRAAKLALAGLVAVSVLALAGCAEREDDDDAMVATDTAATAPQPTGATQPGATTPAGAPPAGSQGLTEADRGFLAKALAANQHELQAAQLGIERAESEQVRAYAQRMQRDHTQLGNQMQPLVQRAGISMAEPQMDMTELETATGEAFDRAFMERMVSDHETAVADFERAASDPAHSAEVRAAATDALPTLQAHLDEARALAMQLGGGTDAPAPDESEAEEGDGAN